MRSSRQRVLEVIGSVIGVSAASLSDESTPDTVDGWDSLRHVQLIVALEEELDIQFTSDDLDRLHSVGEIVRAVAGLTHGGVS